MQSSEIAEAAGTTAAYGHPARAYQPLVAASKRGSSDDGANDQDDPKEIAEVERLRAKLARHRKEAERLADLIRQKQKKADATEALKS
jgi:hypothetical protein